MCAGPVFLNKSSSMETFTHVNNAYHLSIGKI